MALSKVYTFPKLETLLRTFTQQLIPDKLREEAVLDIINKNTIEIAGKLNLGGHPDYMSKAVVYPAYGYKNVYGNRAAYMVSNEPTDTHCDLSIIEGTHGLTTANIGDWCAVWIEEETEGFILARILEIVSEASIKISENVQVANALHTAYVVFFPKNEIVSIDIAQYSIDTIIKVVDSTYGLIPEKSLKDFDNLGKVSQYQKQVFYCQVGKELLFYKGDGVTTFGGTITLFYYRPPALFNTVLVTTTIDLDDKYVPLLIDKCKLDVYEAAAKEPPVWLKESVDTRLAQLAPKPV